MCAHWVRGLATGLVGVAAGGVCGAGIVRLRLRLRLRLGLGLILG